MQTRSYAFVDLETSGVSPSDDRVTEIGIILVDGDTLVEEWSSLVDPGVPIPPEITALTGITNEMARGAPRFAALLGARVLEGLVLQPLLREPQRIAVGHQTRAVGAHQVHQRLALPHVAMQPETAVHRVNHSVATLLELAAPG
jgi:hypothetical protein